MKVFYARPSRTLDPNLERLVAERVLPNELVLQWTTPNERDMVTVCLIDESSHREIEVVSQEMAGLGAGGGCSLVFRRIRDCWEFVEETEWIS